jgi:ribonucleoside-diphosphate reductase alpha chain
MREAKTGKWWEDDGQRALANNSACYTETPGMGVFLKEWKSLYDSKSGERGIFNRVAAQKQAAKNERRDSIREFGTNPCGEIILRSKQFCNLTEVVVRPTDTFEELKTKVRFATILGTLQATQTNFRYLRKEWRTNTEEEALLGVSLTGIMDHPLMNGTDSSVALVKLLGILKQVAIDTNKEWAKKLGINPSAAITCVKPSGTVSQLVDSSSGIHTRHSPYYIRTVRCDKKDPIAKFMVEQGFPVEDDITKPDHNYVFSFPCKAPEGALTRKDISAVDHLNLWKIYHDFWCEHNPSITVSVKEDEWFKVGAWVYENFDNNCGVSFLPWVDHVYQQAPYQECTEEQYNEVLSRMPSGIDWDNIVELEDGTIGIQELACTGNQCEI